MKTKQIDRTKTLIYELRTLVKKSNEEIFKKCEELFKELKHQNNGILTIKDFSKYVNDFMTEDQCRYYLSAISMKDELLPHITKSTYARICYAKSYFKKPKGQYELLEQLKEGTVSQSIVNKESNLNNFLNQVFPDCRDSFNKNIHIFQTLYKLRQTLRMFSESYPKLDDFYKLKTWYEWEEIKLKMDNLIQKPNSKKFYIITKASSSRFSNMKKLFSEYEEIPQTLSIKVTQKELLDKLHLLNKYHVKIK